MTPPKPEGSRLMTNNREVVEAQYDAELRDWSMVDHGDDLRIHGAIYGDKLTSGKHPFPDGSPVVTSTVRSVFDGIAVTRSGTRYKLLSTPVQPLQEGEWRPIETAPTTGVRIIATNPLWPEDRRVRVVWWVNDGPGRDEGQYWQDDSDSEPDPTLWVPLSASPSPNLRRDLVGAAAEAGSGVDQDELTDVVSDAITDSMDMDWSARDGARSVVAALIKEGFVRIKA